METKKEKKEKEKQVENDVYTSDVANRMVACVQPSKRIVAKNFKNSTLTLE